TAVADERAEAAEAPVLQVRYTAPETVQNPDESAKRRMVRLPNGEYVRALNGAVDAPPMQWPNDRPFSPIIGIERDTNGKDWWVHADNTKSTTEMVFRSDLGRHDAVTQVCNPTPALPLEPRELERARQASGTAGQSSGAPNPSAVRAEAKRQ